MAGEPVLAGTRLPLRLLAEAAREQGEGEVCAAFDVDPQAVWFAAHWAAAHPRKGRPPARPAPTVYPEARAAYIAQRHARTDPCSG